MARARAVTHQFEVGKSAWASICAGVFYISVKEKRAYTIATSLRYMLDKIECGEINVNEDLVRDFLAEAEVSKGIETSLAIPVETNLMLAGLRDRMQAFSDRSIRTPQVVHFALAMAPRPFW